MTRHFVFTLTTPVDAVGVTTARQVIDDTSSVISRGHNIIHNTYWQELRSSGLAPNEASIKKQGLGCRFSD